MSKKLKKSLSWLLTLAMVLTMLPMSVFAAGTENLQPGPVTSSDGLVTVEKSAQAVPGKEDTYEVTLEVATEDKVEVQPQDPAHVVLVIDASGSMAGDRLAKTKAAAKEFASIMLGEGAADDNQIAVITYSDDGAIKQEFTHEFSAIETAINGITANGGTNIQGGLYRAEEVIKQDSSDAEKVILLFSDGYPTYCYELTGTASGNCHGSGLGGPATRVNGDTIEITGRNEGKVIGAGSDDVVTGDWWDIFDLFASNLSLTVTCTADYLGHDGFWGKNHTFPKDVEYDYATKSLVDKADTSSATLWEADQAKQLADVYTVLLNPSNSSEAQKAKALMEKLATGDKYYLAEDAEELGELFKGIAGDLITPTNAGTVTDPMAEFVTLDESSISDKNAVDVEGNSFTWNVAASEPVVNGNQKTYTLTYQVTVDTDNAEFKTDVYPLNDTTTFTYRVQGDDQDRTVNFNVPTVYEEAVRYQVSYQWSGNVPAGEKTPDAVTDLADGAEYTVDDTYGEGSTVNTYDEYNNVNGTYTFSGWKLNGTVVTGKQKINASSVELKGEWKYEAVTVQQHTVKYDWGTENVPSTVTLPGPFTVDNNATHTVNTTYYNGYTVTADGGTYTFSGWDKSGAITVTDDVTIKGSWTFVPAAPTEVTVTYKVVNGTWADGTTEITETLTPGDKLNNIPNVEDAKPNKGCKTPGTWDTTPTSETTVSANTVYTYTFEKIPVWHTAYDSIRIYMDEATQADFDALEGQLAKQVRIYSDKYPELDHYRLTASLSDYWWTENILWKVTASDISKIVLAKDNIADPSSKIVIPIEGNDIYNVTVSEGTEWVGLLSYKYLKIEITKNPEKVTYSVLYDRNGADSGTVPVDSNRYQSGDTVNVLENTGNLAKDKAVFLGFSQTKNGLITTKDQEVKAGIIESFTITGNTKLYAVWAKDEDGDGTPDYDQYRVTYKIVNGTWANGSTEIVDYVTFDADGKALLGAGPDVSTVKPNTNYLAEGAWDVEPVEGTTITGDATYTYTLKTNDNVWANTYDYIRIYMDDATKADFDALEGQLAKQVRIYSDKYPELDHYRLTAPLSGYWWTENILWKVTASDISKIVLAKDNIADPSSKIVIPIEGNDIYSVTISEGTEWVGLLSYKYLKIEITKNPEKVTYSVIYDGNGADSGTVPVDSNRYQSGETVSVLENTGNLAKDKAVFLGWTTDTKAIGQVYGAGDKLPDVVDKVKIAGPTTVYAVWGADTNGDGIADAQQVVITPADIVVYTGGVGYDGVVATEGGATVASNGIPEPGYYFILPYALNEKLQDEGSGYVDLSGYIRLDDVNSDTRQWVLEFYDGTTNSEDSEGYIYRLVEVSEDGQNGTPAKLVIKDSDGNIVTNDQLTISNDALYQDYTMSLDGSAVKVNQIAVEVKIGDEWVDVNTKYGEGTVAGLILEEGKLTVRGEATTTPTVTTDVVTYTSDISDTNADIVAVASTDTNYNINSSNISVTNGNIALFTDGLLPNDVLNDYLVKQNLIGESAKVIYQYLDLVDTNNGNAYVTTEDLLDIYWKLPDDADPDGTFYVVHFNGLDRNYDVDDLESLIGDSNHSVTIYSKANGNLEIVTIDDEQYLKFATSTFSPFALVYDAKYTITANAGAGGSISPSGSVTVAYGGNQEFTITANSGYHIEDVTVDGVSVGAVSSYTFNDVQANHTIHATFDKDSSGTVTPDEYTLRYDTNGGNEIDSESEKKPWTKEYEDLPTPVRSGYIFEGWYRNSTLTMRVTEDVYVNSGTVTLYAKWSEKPGPDDTGVSDWLETEEHNAYLSGYPDSTFRADRNMTRAEVAQMFYALLLDKDVTITKSFSDVPDDAWYATAVKTLASLGMMDGYPDGTFRPDEPITRAEFATVGLAFAYDAIDADCSYYDVSTSAWYYTYVAQATTYGWIGGYPDNTFRPSNNITRVEVCVIVNNMLGRSADERYIDRNEDELVHFMDLSDSYWGYYTIMEATNSHEYTGNYTNETWKSVK